MNKVNMSYTHTHTQTHRHTHIYTHIYKKKCYSTLKQERHYVIWAKMEAHRGNFTK